MQKVVFKINDPLDKGLDIGRRGGGVKSSIGPLCEEQIFPFYYKTFFSTFFVNIKCYVADIINK